MWVQNGISVFTLFAWFIYCFWWTAFLMSWTLSSPKKIDWSVLRVTEFFFFSCELGFFIFLILTLPIIPFHRSLNFCMCSISLGTIIIIPRRNWNNDCSAFWWKWIALQKWKSPFLLIFVVFDRFINQVLLLCCFADKCHSVCENGWDLLKIVLLQEIHCFFWHFSYLQSVSPATCQFTKCTNVQCHSVARSVLGFT